MKTNIPYEGWSNEETWLLNLTIDNERALNEAKHELLRSIRRPDMTPCSLDQTAIETFCRGLVSAGHIKRKLLVNVNWPELTQDWLVLAREL